MKSFEELFWKSISSNVEKANVKRGMCIISEDLLEYFNWTNALSIKFFKRFIILPLDCKANCRNYNYWIQQVRY